MAEIKVIPKWREHPADHFLRLWVTYMHGEAKPQGYPTKASGGIQNYTSLDLENVAAYEKMDRILAQKTDAAVADLPVAERCAIHHAYLHAVYRFRDREKVLQRAMDSVEAGLRRRDVWMG